MILTNALYTMNNCCLHRRRSLFWILVIFLLSSQNGLFAQDYRVDRWEAKDGLAQNSVKVIQQSPDGYLWLATEGGLSRFDGVSFTNFGLDSDPAFKSDRIGAMYSNNGDILFWNYLAGFLVYKNHKFHNVSIANSKPRIRYFTKCSRTHILLKDYIADMSVINDGDYTEVEIESLDLSIYPKDVFSYDDYNVWVYEDRISFKDHDIKPIQGKPDIILDNPVRQASQDIESGYYWIYDNHFYYKYKEDKLVATYTISKELLEQDAWYMLPRNGELWINKWGTTLIYNLDESTGNYTLFSDYQDICPEGIIDQTFIDRENNVWFGTSTCGLLKIKPPRITYLDKDDWVHSKNFYPILKGQDDQIFIGGHISGIVEIDSTGNVLENPILDALPKKTVNSIEQYNGALYFSMFYSNNLLKYENGKLDKIYFPDSVITQTNAIYSAPSGRLLASYKYGYLELIDDKLVSKNVVEEPFTFISNFHETADGVLWIASSDKLIAYDEIRKQIVYDSREVIPDISGFREITEDDEGRIFVGTYGHGFIIIENDKTTQVSKQNGLSENVVSTITEDSFGNIWLTGNKGLTRLVKSKVLAIATGEIETIRPVVYNKLTDRMRTSEFNGGHQQAKCFLKEDCYIFPSMNGAVIVDFAKMQNTDSAPPVLIEKLVYNDQIFYPDSTFETDYTADRLDIFYTSTSFISPKQIGFKYKLDGFDNDWNDVGGDRKASYGKLPPGNYTFLVKAQNHEGVWNEEGAQYSFRIIPPFYKTNWFNVLLVLLTIGITALVVNGFNQMKRKRGAVRQMLQLEAIVTTEEKERKRIATDLHDGIGQLLSVIKINLGIVKDKILQDEPGDSIKLVDNSKKDIEEVMSEIRNISYNLLPPSLEQFGLTIAMAEEVSKLKDDPYLHVHFNHATKDIKFDSKIEIVLYRVFQELLNNAIKHAEATEITIQLIQHEDSLMLMMEDDGNGFDLHKAYTKVDSSGLKNIFSRVKSIKGKINIDSQPGAGANTTIEIPLKK